MRSLPVYALALVGVLMASCAKQEASAPAAAPAAGADASCFAQDAIRTPTSASAYTGNERM